MSEPHADAQADLDELLPQPGAVKAGGETLAIAPLTFGQLPRALSLAAPFLDAIGTGVDPQVLILTHGERVIALVAHLTGKPLEWVGALPLDEAAELTGALIMVNADFFIRRVAPQMQRTSGLIRGRFQSLRPTKPEKPVDSPLPGEPPGAAPLNGSSPTATASMT